MRACAHTLRYPRRLASTAIRIHGSATEQEAAAIAIAVERFLGDTTPSPQATAITVNPWFHAGLLEATGNDLGRMPAAAESGLNT